MAHVFKYFRLQEAQTGPIAERGQNREPAGQFRLQAQAGRQTEEEPPEFATEKRQSTAAAVPAQTEWKVSIRLN